MSQRSRRADEIKSNEERRQEASMTSLRLRQTSRRAMLSIAFDAETNEDRGCRVQGLVDSMRPDDLDWVVRP